MTTSATTSSCSPRPPAPFATEDRRRLYKRWRCLIAAVDRLGAGLLELHVRPEPQVTREQMFLIGQAFDQMLTALEKIGHLPRPATRPPGPP